MIGKTALKAHAEWKVQDTWVAARGEGRELAGTSVQQGQVCEEDGLMESQDRQVGLSCFLMRCVLTSRVLVEWFCEVWVLWMYGLERSWHPESSGNKEHCAYAASMLYSTVSLQHSAQLYWRRRAGGASGSQWAMAPRVYVSFNKIKLSSPCSEAFLSSWTSPGFHHTGFNQRPSWETVWTPTGIYYWKAKWGGRMEMPSNKTENKEFLQFNTIKT